MKKLTLNLFIGVLAIGITTSVMAEKNDKPEPVCDNATLNGAYHFSKEDPYHVQAGQWRFDGAGNGDVSYTTHWIDQAQPEGTTKQQFTYSIDPTEYCKYTLHGFSTGDKVLYTNLNGYSGSITGVSVGSGHPIAYDIFRGPKTPARY